MASFVVAHMQDVNKVAVLRNYRNFRYPLAGRNPRDVFVFMHIGLTLNLKSQRYAYLGGMSGDLRSSDLLRVH